MNYDECPLSEAYTLQNAGSLVLVCTCGSDGRYDLAPIAWCCPLDYEPVSRFLCVLDTGHKTFRDLQESKEFAIALPRASQKELVDHCGSVSGFAVDKYDKFGIEFFKARRVNARIPSGVAGWIECSLSTIVIEGTSAIVTGNAVHAEAVPDSWKERVHYVTEDIYFIPGDKI